MSEKVTEDMIGCLCKFWDTDEGEKKPIFGILKQINKLNYCDELGASWEHCRPVKPDEVKFYDYDDNRYNCCAENEVLRLKVAELEEQNKELKERLADDSKTIYTYRGKKISALDYYLGKAKETLEEIKENTNGRNKN